MKLNNDIGYYYGLSLVNEHVVRKEGTFSLKESFNLIQKIVEHFINKPDPLVVPVYKFEVLEELTDPDSPSMWGTYKYAYEMKRLGVISKAEKQVIDYCHRRIYEIGRYHDLKEDSSDPFIRSAWKNHTKLAGFLKEIIQQDRYTDLHGGNILKDENDQFLLIDLEGFMKLPMNRPENNWL